jgi:hypothetical protein
MKDTTWLHEGEEILGQWSVTTDGQKSYGKIYATNQYFRYNQQGSLGHISEGAQKHLVHVDNHQFLAIPYSQIHKVEIVKQYLIFKILKVSLTSGDSLAFRFGVMSPQSAFDAINRHLQ